MRQVTDMRQTGCPWQALRDPYVAAVLHWSREVKRRGGYPGSLPEAIARGVSIYESAFGAVRAFDQQREHARLEEENAQREANAARGFVAQPTIRRPTKRRR